VFGAAVGEQAGDVEWEVAVAQRLGCLVEEVSARGDVEPRFVAVAGEGGVAPLAVELVGTEDEGAVDGGALGAVRGRRVGVVEVSVVNVGLGEVDAPAVVKLDPQLAVPERRQRAGLSVDAGKAGVVAGCDDAVADREDSLVGA
jgi:hypothetical protein